MPRAIGANCRLLMVPEATYGTAPAGDWLRMPAPAVPEASAQLLRLAEAYDATQPSYAADLRAAAWMGARD